MLAKTRQILPVPILLTVLGISFGMAQPNINGYVKGFAYMHPADQTFSRLGTRFQTRFSNEWGAKVGYLATLNFQVDRTQSYPDSVTVGTDPLGQRRSGFDIYPVEFYADLHLRRADIRIGQQYIFWGATDWVNPTDIINPWDYEHISSEIEDYRLPVTAVSAKYYWREFTIQGVWIPLFTPAVMPLPEGTTVHYPDVSYTDPQFGLRVTSYVGATDISISAYRGYDALPEIRTIVDTSTLPPAVNLEAKYYPITMLGFDFARTFDQVALKGEAAWCGTEDNDGRDPDIKNPFLKSVVGLDYNPSNKWSINAQYIIDHQLKYQAAYVNDDEDETTYSLSTRIAWEPIDFVTSQVISVYNLADQDLFTLGFISWELADAFHVTLGTVLFQGPEDSIYGQMDSADQWFVELKRSF